MKILKEEAARRVENVKRVENDKNVKRYLDMVKAHLDRIAEILGAEVAGLHIDRRTASSRST